MNKNAEIDGMAAIFHGLRLPNGLRLDEVQVETAHAELKTEPFALMLDEPGSITVTISSSSLAKFIASTSPPNLTNISVKISDGKVEVSTIVVMLMPVRVVALCTLDVVDDAKINVILHQTNIGGPVRAMIESQIRKLNPVFEVANLPLDVKITSVQLEDGKLMLSGKAMMKA